MATEIKFGTIPERVMTLVDGFGGGVGLQLDRHICDDLRSALSGEGEVVWFLPPAAARGMLDALKGALS